VGGVAASPKGDPYAAPGHIPAVSDCKITFLAYLPHRTALPHVEACSQSTAEGWNI